jgi:hypothetical protein
MSAAFTFPTRDLFAGAHMSSDSFPFFIGGTQRQLRCFYVVRHHVDGDRQLCSFWCASIEEAVIEAVNTLSTERWHIESIIMNCDGLSEEEIWQEVERQNFDNEFFSMMEHFHDNQS